MKPALAPLALALLLSLPAQANEAGSQAIAAIGRINGIALACQQPALVSRARNAIQTGAPKTRAYGEAFENATNTAYLAQGKGDCPSATTLAASLSEAEQALKTAFPTH